MTKFQEIVTELKKQERHLSAQLAGIRTAIASLEFGGGGGVPAPAIIETPNAAGKSRTRRKMSAAQKRAVSARMKKYWAARRREKK